MVRQSSGKEFPHRRPVDVSIGDQVGGQGALVALASRHNHRLPHAWMAGERGLDLAELDAVSADLDLLVGAAQVVERAVLAEAGQVAASIQSPALAEQIASMNRSR